MNASVIGAGLYAVEVIGIAAFALSGIIEAARRRMDVVGITAVAGLAAFGGGTLRDLLLDRRPLFWVEHNELLWMVFALALAAPLFLRSRHFNLTERAMQVPDAVGLGLFCASGTQIALAMDLPLLVSVLMGLFTAIIGGVLRDIVCNEIPRVFSDHRPYALCAFAGGWVLVGADRLGFEEWLCLFLGTATATVSRIAAIQLDWEIPRWRTDQ
ncbi:MAG: trimeric intracellular cation channel family protein [Burkholderiaceae bacterium]|jgi:uncharacterized membrane protein YeiH